MPDENVKSTMLTQTSAMKYQKVRDYLENKTLEELRVIQENENPSADPDKMHTTVLLSKAKSIDEESKQSKIDALLNKTQDTVFEEEPSYALTTNFGSPKVEGTLRTKVKPRVSKTALGRAKREPLRVSNSRFSRKSKVE